LVEWLSVTVTQRGPIASVEAFAAYGTVTLLRLQWLGVQAMLHFRVTPRCLLYDWEKSQSTLGEKLSITEMAWIAKQWQYRSCTESQSRRWKAQVN